MPPIYPDLAWYSSQGERKGLPGRCPHTSIHHCPRYFETVALLSDVKVTAPLPKDLHDAALAKWREHELAPATGETAASISGGKDPNCYSNFCPEVAYDTFKLFASTLIRINDSIDRQIAERLIEKIQHPKEKIGAGHGVTLNRSTTRIAPCTRNFVRRNLCPTSRSMAQ